MATIAEGDFFVGVRDPIYTVSGKPVSIDTDTVRKATRIIPATADGSSSLATSSLNGRRTVFNFSAGNQQRMRWDTTTLEVDLLFTGLANNYVTPATNVAPSWNLFGRLIDQIKLNFNGSGQEIYNKTGGYYLPDFTSRLLRYYTLEQLNKKDDTCFTPINDYEYIYTRALATKYANGGNNVKSDGVNYIQFANAAGAATVCAAANATFNNARLAGGLDSARLRYFKYIYEDATKATSTSNLRYVTLRVPFMDLFPRFQGIMRNLRSVQLEIVWTSDKNILEHLSPILGTGALVPAEAGSDGYVHVMNARIMADEYVMSTGQSIENLTDKVSGESDNISFLSNFSIGVSANKFE